MSKSNEQPTRRQHLSTANIIIVAAFFAGAVASIALGKYPAAVVLVVVGLVGLVGALYATRSNARDISRINAIQYRDERDRLLAKEGFAIVGAAALILSIAEVVLATLIFPNPVYFVAVFQLLALCLVWGIATAGRCVVGRVRLHPARPSPLAPIRVDHSRHIVGAEGSEATIWRESPVNWGGATCRAPLAAGRGMEASTRAYGTEQALSGHSLAPYGGCRAQHTHTMARVTGETGAASPSAAACRP